MTSGTFLKHCRKKAGISQSKLADLLHRNQSDISKLEKDRTSIDIATFRDWTKVTNQMEVGIAFLYGVDPSLIVDAVTQYTGVSSILQIVMQVTGAA